MKKLKFIKTANGHWEADAGGEVYKIAAGRFAKGMKYILTLGSIELHRSRYLERCKDKADQHYYRKQKLAEEKKEYSFFRSSGCLENIRLPYKDD